MPSNGVVVFALTKDGAVLKNTEVIRKLGSESGKRKWRTKNAQVNSGEVIISENTFISRYVFCFLCKKLNYLIYLQDLLDCC